MKVKGLPNVKLLRCCLPLSQPLSLAPPIETVSVDMARFAPTAGLLLFAVAASDNVGSAKSAVAGTLASSRFGRAVVRRYLSEPGRNLVDAVLAYALRRDGKREAGLLENALWDVFARVAVVVRAKALPPGVDRQTLSEATIDFCQCFLRHARDRRLEAKRRRVRHGADPEPVDLVELRLQAGVIVKTWRELVEPQCSTGTLERYRHLTTYFFGEAQLLDVFENHEYRQLLSVMESNIIELLEHY
eukprot:UC1_evm4s583